MKFFKHFTDAAEGKSLQTLMAKMGLEGYAAYFLLMELCAKRVEKDLGREFLETDFKFRISSRLVREKLRMKSVKVEFFLSLSSELNLLQFSKVEDEFIFEVPKLLEYMDRDAKRPRRKRDECAANARLDKDKDKDKEEEREKEKPSPPAIQKSVKDILRVEARMKNFALFSHIEKILKDAKIQNHKLAAEKATFAFGTIERFNAWIESKSSSTTLVKFSDERQRVEISKSIGFEFEEAVKNHSVPEAQHAEL